jgi:hypothetical protein
MVHLAQTSSDLAERGRIGCNQTFFYHEDRLVKFEKLGDPLPRLGSVVD